MRKKSSHALVVVGWAERQRNPTICSRITSSLDWCRFAEVFADGKRRESTL